MAALIPPPAPADAVVDLRSAVVGAESVLALWETVRAALEHAAPHAAIGLFLRCHSSGLWQQVAEVEHSRIAITKTFAAARPALVHSEPLVRWDDSGAYLPLRDDARRVTGCVVLAFEGKRSLARSSEPAVVEAAEVLASALDRLRRVDAERLARRWRVAVQTLPRLAHAATTREELLAIVGRTMEFVCPGAVVHVLVTGDGGALRPFGLAAPGPDCSGSVTHLAGSAVKLDKLQLSRPPTATILGPSERQIAAAPIHDAARRRSGALVVEIPLAGRVFDPDDLQSLLAIADVSALALDRLDTTRELRILQGRDPETGCQAADSLRPSIAAALDRAGASNSSTSLLRLQIDTRGAAYDPRLIAPLAVRLAAAADAEGATVFRVSQAGFAVLAPDRGARTARQLAQRLRLLVRATTPAEITTVRIGIAVAPLHAADADGLTVAVETALDLALAGGSDTTAMAPPAGMSGQRPPTALGERYGMLLSMARLVDELHFDGRPHSSVVSHRGRELAVLLGVDRGVVETATLAGELHAIGRALLPPTVFADGSPAQASLSLIMSNVVLGGRLVATSGFPRVGEAIAAMHECWDGSGGPGGLCGEAIPVVARILAAVEAYEADLAAGTAREAGRRLLDARGRRFDPRVVDLLWQRATAAAGD